MMGSEASEGIAKTGGRRWKEPICAPLQSITERVATLLQDPRPPLSQSRRSAYPLSSAAGSVNRAFLHGFPRAKGIKG